MNTRLDTRVLVFLSLLIGIGAALHTIMPPIIFGVTPDLSLVMMMLGVILFPKGRYVLLASLATGFISALTTGFPGGQIANIIEKPITAFIILGLIKVLEKSMSKQKLAPTITAIGTLISGGIFLFIPVVIMGLGNAGFSVLYASVVLPTALLNTVLMTVVYPIVQNITKRTRISNQTSNQTKAA
ncbi:tryptophan transporter [Pontibacillus marinus]|uniref:Tryptophan transporter n=1 Tax=Pontibacillus marinus BH030004 = DSM 16465 TaxID=1385511 RepID=A0A0A5HHS0_9BACI|nr:tryptophan transporter [Pontibacillus marinus]KGX83207.1 tryptophan transporter [Pontibacillus marinus BH030004 = DSM 16465]